MVVAAHNGGRRILAVHVRFTHAGHQEHLVIHGKTKKNTNQQGRQERQHRARVIHPEEGAHEAQLVNRYHGTEARQHREEEAHRGNQRHHNRAEHQNQHQEGQTHHHTQVQGQLLREHLRDVNIAAGLTRNAQRHLRTLNRNSHGAQLVDELFSLHGACTVGRNHLENHEGTVIGHAAGNHGLHVRATVFLHRRRDINLRLLSLLLTHVRGGMRNRNQRRAHTLTELVLDERVRLVRGTIGGVVRGIRQTQTHLRHGGGNRQQRQRTGHQGQQRTSQHEAQPAVRLLGAFGILRAALRNLLRGVDGCPQLLRHNLRARHGQHRRGEGNRNQGGNNHTERGGVTHHAQEGNTGHVQRHERNNHGARRENHGVTARAVRQGNRLNLRHAVQQVRAVAVENEQRIVDTDRQAEHQTQRVGGGAHLHDGGERERAEHTHHHAHQRHENRQAGSHQGAEHNHQHDEGDDHTRNLTGMRASTKRGLTQVRIKLDSRTVQVRRLDIRHDLLQICGRNLKNLLLKRDRRNRHGLILRDHTVAGSEVVELLLALQLLTLRRQLTLSLLQLVALLIQLLLTLSQLILPQGDFCATRINLLLALNKGIALLIERVLLFGQLRLLGVELLDHGGG